MSYRGPEGDEDDGDDDDPDRTPLAPDRDPDEYIDNDDIKEYR